jgi:para-nitrobenzyl esterase
LIAPASKNLFQRAIIESGGCDITQIPLTQAEMIGDEISSYFCNSSSDVISCLQSIDASILLQYAQSKNYLNFFSSNAFHPSIDGLIIPDSITNLFQTKTFSTNISLLTGTTNAEFGLFIAGGFEPGWQISNLNQTVLSQWVQLYSKGQSAYLNTTYNPYVDPYVPPILVNYYGLTDALSTGIFQCPVRRTAAYVTNNGSGSVYLYSFEYIPLSSPFSTLSQSVHGQELPFVFNSANSSALTQIIFPVNTFNGDEQLLAWTMSLLWIRFIVNGNPNTPLNNETMNSLINQLSQLGGWPMYSTTNLSSYLIFSNIATGNSSATIRLATSGYHSPTCPAWDAIVPNPNIIKQCNVGYTGPDCSITNDAILNTVSFFVFNPISIFMHFYYLNYF